jgi:hypothetical protein
LNCESFMAYADMAKEKKRKDIDLDGESIGSLVEKMQNAYRRGDLDLMDSIDNLMEKSQAFREKFLYKRNEIQANSIDSIVRHRSLFAGVGAAHLPGERGVIELLRRKGYTLRPIRMTDRDAQQKDLVDKMKVKLEFTTQYAPDGMYSVEVPGKLYALKNNYMPLNRWQYADMNNGTYYLVTRVKTYSSFLAVPGKEVLQKIDSLLYENIPGKILSKKAISKDGYTGFDISNRTRRGDLQRYQVFVTPFEIIIFKMSGKADYVAGEEAARFFSSIHLRPESNDALIFRPKQGGFSINLPQQPHQYFDNINNERWEYEAVDKTTGNAYLLIKKSNYNFNFIEEDSFDLSLVEESFRNPELFGQQLSRKMTSIDGSPALLVREQLKTGQSVNAAYLLKGPHYFVISKRGNSATDSSFDFINSFKWEPYEYGPASVYTDTFLRISMHTPVQPQIDAGIRSIIEQTAADAANGNNASGYISYWQKLKNGSLRSDSTGEMISVQVQEYPKYFYIRDSSKFWKSEIEDYLNKNDMVLKKGALVQLPGNVSGYHFTVQDTGSSRMIERMILLKDKYIYSLAAMADTGNHKSAFLEGVFKTVNPVTRGTRTNLYENKLPMFFNDLFSTDSATSNKAQQSISNIYFGSRGAADLYNAINRISVQERDYYNIKSKLIAELGYIKDSVNNNIPIYLKKIYDQTADTSLFQNEVIQSLARLKTQASFKMLKEIMLQDPPIFDDNEDYDVIFDNLEDTLELSRDLFPDLYQLSSLADYKAPVTNLLVALVDSGLLHAKDYEKYYPAIYIDAKVAQKKQQGKDEKQMQEDKKRANDGDDNNGVVRSYGYNSNRSDLNDYAVLLMPFYDREQNVKQYFRRLLESKDEGVKMDAAVLLLRNNKIVADSIIQKLAADDKYRGSLYYKLEKAGRLDRFPAQHKNQLAMARSFMVMAGSSDKMDSIVFLQKQSATLKGKTGAVYFFKYRIRKTDDWKIGVSGLQPLNEKEVNSNDDLAVLTDKKIKDHEPLEEQLGRQLKIMLFSFHKSAKNFFSGDDFYNNFKSLNGYDED